MLHFFSSLFNTAGYTSAWDEWDTSLGWLHVVSALATWAAFTTAVVALNYYVLRRETVRNPRAFWIFQSFLFVCGTLFLVNAIVLWWPTYRFQGVLALASAVLSWAAVITLIPSIPRFLTLRRPEELEAEIAERKKVEETLRTSEQRFRTMAETMPTMVAIFQGTGHAYVNLAAESMLGYTREELLHRSFVDYVHPDCRQMVIDRSLARQRGDAVPTRYEIKLVNKAGAEIWVDFSAAVIDYAGRPAVLGISIDVTQRKAMEGALRTAMEAAESASRAKSTFLANMSHEIRTPMNAVLGMTELVLDTELTRDQRQYLETVRDSADSLLSLINDILDFSKIEAGKLDLEKAPFDLRDTVEDTMRSLAVRAHSEGIELACRIDPAIPNFLIGDRTRLRQVLVNLVGNALKFTPSGEVVMDVQATAPIDGEVSLHFVVSDTGIGIAEEKIGSIFNAFEQADASMTRRYGGTGLGLAITSRLVQLMAGKIWVESRVGHGSTFHFTAQLGVPEPGTVPAKLSQPVQVYGGRALIVDDNATNRRILEEVLCNWGMRTASAASAAEALGLLRESIRLREPFHLVLSDVNMPDVDGFELVERCRRDEDLRGSVFVMLTSATRSGDAVRCKDLKVAAHLVKPVKQSELYDAITESLGIASPAAHAAKADAGLMPMRPLNVLLAEDSVANQKLAIGLLSKWGHQITVAVDGRQAVSKATSDGPFDLILMDVQMPEMDGFEATARIREWEQSSGREHTPVVAMTAHAMKGDRERCTQAGMDGYVSKPVRAAELARTIAEFTQKADGDEPAATCEVSANSEVNAAAETGSIDWSVALSSVGNDRELLRSVIQASLEEWPSFAAQLRDGIHADNGETVHRAIHTLGNAFRTFGANDARAALERLDAAVRAKDSPDLRLDEFATAMDAASRELVGFLNEAATGSPGVAPLA